MHAFYGASRGFEPAFVHLKLFNFFFLDTSHFIDLLGLGSGLELGLYRLCSTTFFQLIFFDSQTFTKNNINMWQLFEIRS